MPSKKKGVIKSPDLPFPSGVIMDLKTGKTFTVRGDELAKRFLTKESGRFVRAE